MTVISLQWDRPESEAKPVGLRQQTGLVSSKCGFSQPGLSAERESQSAVPVQGPGRRRDHLPGRRPAAVAATVAATVSATVATPVSAAVSAAVATAISAPVTPAIAATVAPAAVAEAGVAIVVAI